MKYVLTLPLLSLLAACAGNQGNPNGMAYADEPGGTIATQPQTIGTRYYDPDQPAAPFEDMRAGGPAVMNGPAPLNTMPARPR